LLVVSGSRSTRPLLVVGVIGALVMIVVGMTIAVVIAFARDVSQRLPKNWYGLVTGVDDRNRGNGTALCTWLARELELTAGLPAGEAPLTFGMLWCSFPRRKAA